MASLIVPLEIIDAIFAFLEDEKRALFQLTLTCHLLRACAEPFLYSEVVFKDPLDVGLVSFRETISKVPRLAALVTEYSGFSEPFWLEQGQVWLPNLINLKRLHLRARLSDVKLMSQLPRGLERLEIEGHFSPSHLGEVLLGMDNLHYLVLKNFPIYRTRDLKPFHPLVCRNLRILSGGFRAANAVLPGRRVARFEWSYPKNEPVQVEGDLLSRLSPHLANIRSLSYIAKDPSFKIHPLYDLPNYLHSLSFLEIQIMDATDWTSIPKLSHLRVLLVLEPSYIFMSMLDEPDRIIDLFDKCPHLKRVDVGGRDHHVTLTCKRWLRGSAQPIDVPLHVAERGRLEFVDDIEL